MLQRSPSMPAWGLHEGLGAVPQPQPQPRQESKDLAALTADRGQRQMGRSRPARLPPLQLQSDPEEDLERGSDQEAGEEGRMVASAACRAVRRGASISSLRSAATASTEPCNSRGGTPVSVTPESYRAPVTPSHEDNSEEGGTTHCTGIRGVLRMRRSLTSLSGNSEICSKVPSFCTTTNSERSTALPASTATPTAEASVGGRSSVAVACQIREWKLGACIGSGSFGSVFKAQDSQSGSIFAVKRAADGGSTKDVEKLQAEIDICSSLSHPNIVRYLGSCRREGSLFILLEYVPGGSLASLLKVFGALNPKLLRRAYKHCLEGLHYLHSRKPHVMHRDLKCANLLVDLNFQVKLADFGCSKMSDASTSFSTIGSVPWMAPEVLQGNVGYGRKADIWSLGCTVLEMATAEKPWGDGAFDNLMCAVRTIAMSDELPQIPDNMPEWGKDMIKSCLNREVNCRPSTSRLLRAFSATQEL